MDGIKSLTLRQIVARLPCCACSNATREAIEWIRENLEIAPRISDPHHVSTRGSGGEDTPENLAPLCRRCHSEIDAPWGGTTHMIGKYPGFKAWLEAAGRTDILEKAVYKRSK